MVTDKSKPYFTISNVGWEFPYDPNPEIELKFVSDIQITHRLFICICGNSSFNVKENKMYCEECGEYYGEFTEMS